MRRLAAWHVRANVLTVSSLCLAVLAAALYAAGPLPLAGGLYLFSGLFDLLDGHVARETSTATKSGAFLDSVCDRYAELLVMGGIALVVPSRGALAVTLLALSGSLMVSYTRARGEALGVKTAHVGFLQRPERILVVGGVSLLGVPELLLWALGAVAILANATAAYRFWHTYRKLVELPALTSDVPSPAAPHR